MKFPVGRIVATPGFLQTVQRTGDNPFHFLCRHVSGDWGDVDQHDWDENDHSLANGFRLLSAYRLKDGTRIWLITEANRASTTFLLPEEY